MSIALDSLGLFNNSYPAGYDNGDPWLIAVLLMFVVSLIASGSVQRTFKRFASIPAQSGTVAAQMAQNMLYDAGSNVTVTQVSGSLTDHFNPKTGVVGLSDAVYDQSSVSALAVAAHEIGHVMQYQEGYTPIKIRNFILPVARIGSGIAPYMIILSLILGATGLGMAGLILYAAVFLFQIATLPVEFNASRRALNMLTAGGYIGYDQEASAKKVLNASAMTYVVAALATFVSLLRFASLLNRRR